LLKILASIKDPEAVKIQPNMLMLPNFPKLAGRTKIPAPIIFPMINDVAENNPIFSF
jgi:hypothetical protein